MNNHYLSRKMHRAFDESADYTFSMGHFAPDIAQNACMSFPLQEIAADLGIHDASAVTLGEVMSNKLQSVNAVFVNMASRTFSGLAPSDANRAPISLDLKSSMKTVQRDDLRVIAANGEDYFCANISLIRKAVEQYSGAIYGDIDEYARALQKALVAKALHDNKPVIIMECIMKDEDKVILSRCDRYLRDMAVNDNDAQPKMELARKG